MKLRSAFFEKRDNNIRNERGDTTTIVTEIEMIIKDYYEQ